MESDAYPIGSSDLEKVDCPVCGAARYDAVMTVCPQAFNTPGTRHIDWMFHIVRCRQCDMVFTNPRPKMEWSLRRYNTRYETAVTKNRNKFFHQLNALASYPGGIGIIRKWRKHGRLLDVGSSSGIFIGLAELAGYDAYGLDVDRSAVEIADVIVPDKVYLGDVHELDLPLGHYDVVTLWNVIEHLREPVSMMERAHSLLKPGGIIYMETPNATLSVLRRSLPVVKSIPKINRPTFLWPYEHIMFFTPKSIRAALRLAGFGRMRIYTHGWQTVFRHGNIVPSGGRLSHMPERIKKNLYNALFYASGRAINFMPSMTVVAEKPDHP